MQCTQYVAQLNKQTVCTSLIFLNLINYNGYFNIQGLLAYKLFGLAIKRSKSKLHLFDSLWSFSAYLCHANDTYDTTLSYRPIYVTRTVGILTQSVKGAGY